MPRTNSSGCCIVYITAKDSAEAERIGKALVESRLAACANIFERIHSLYWWDNAVQDDFEAALIVKTRERLVPALIKKVKSIHSYTCPCIVSVPIRSGNPDFVKWIKAETKLS
jgi:periplasmic divalent cation tolerance protein